MKKRPCIHMDTLHRLYKIYYGLYQEEELKLLRSSIYLWDLCEFYAS